MSNRMVEKSIRDRLAENLSFIEKGLSLIQIEYPLPNPFGAKGFIDILATDENNNYVIIEIKRSNDAARQTITELSKYAALIKQHHHVRNSEVRLIVISSEWHDLHTPFSEFIHETDYNLEGFELLLNGANEPTGLTRIEPVIFQPSRQFSKQHFIFLFENIERRDNALPAISASIRDRGISDFVLLSSESETTHIPYPFAIYAAAHLYTKEKYLTMLKSFFPDAMEEAKELQDEYSDEEFLQYLSQFCWSSIGKADSVEIGYPKKFSSMLEDRGWNISGISRYGYFQGDTRLKDKQIIDELIGLGGESDFWFFGAASSTRRAKLKEIKETFGKCLIFNDPWKNAIASILHYIDLRYELFSVVVSIFSPDNIMSSIQGAGSTGSESYLPGFEIVVTPDDNEGDTEVFHGVVYWDLSVPNLSVIMKNHFDEDAFDFFLHTHMGSIHNMDEEIMENLGLTYGVEYCKVSSLGISAKQDIDIKGPMIVEKPSKRKTLITQMIIQNATFISDLNKMFDENCQGPSLSLIYDQSSRNG